MNARSLLVAVALISLGCEKLPPLPGRRAASPGAARLSRAAEQGKALLEQGQLDAALEKLKESPSDPDCLYYQGLVWLKKAEAAAPVESGMKPEELAALESFEKATAAKADHALAHQAIADLIAPYALQKHGPLPGGKKRPPAKPTPKPSASPEEPEVDMTPERVLREYHLAMQADAAATVPVEALIRFARDMQLLDEADAGYRNLIVRQKEKPEPLVAYGDFLANDRTDRIKAIEQYGMALVWKTDDADTKNKIADLYITMGEEHFAAQEYAAAQARFSEAKKYVTDPQSYQAKTIQGYLGKLAAMRR